MKILEATIALLDEVILATLVVGALTFIAVALNIIGLGEALIIGAILVAVIVFVIYKAVEAHKAKVKVGIETYIGKKAKVVETRGKSAIIMVEGELWKAETEAETILSPEDTVIIVGFEEGKFIVKPFKRTS